jgi:predicted transcriptional regulator YdeE
MGKIIKLQVEELPALCVVGKQLKVDMQELQKENPIPAFWGKCFSDETFATLEKLTDYIVNDAYVGWMADWSSNDGYFTYICGMLMKVDCPIPEGGFVSRTIEPSTVAIGWIQGPSTSEVCSMAHHSTQKALEEDGYSCDNAQWSMELYNCPRFTTPDENGNIILDYYIPCNSRNK